MRYNNHYKKKIYIFFLLSIIIQSILFSFQIDTLIQSKCYLENKYLNTKKLWQEAEEKLQELRYFNIKFYS